MNNNLKKYQWINKPEKISIENENLSFFTEPNTDFWQRTYYGFRNDNGHIFGFNTSKLEFSYSLFTQFTPRKLFDQCGVIIYQDSENWFKASIEFHAKLFSRLGSVVTNYGFSDWATTDISSEEHIKMHYRLSRRNKDFLIENSDNGVNFKQMRIFHLHNIEKEIRVGLYACSPLKSSFLAEFRDIHFGECSWKLHSNLT